MKRLMLRCALVMATVGVLVAFVFSLMPYFHLPLEPVAIMLALMVLMVLLHRGYMMLPPIKEQAEPILPSTVEKSSIIILGPYAAKWFSQIIPNGDTRFSGQAVWLLVTEPDELRRRLHDISRHAPGTTVMAYFPLLPDGHETSGIITEKLISWQRQFSALLKHLTLPCILAIYTRLSNERRSNNRQNATWTGEFDLSQQQAVSYITAMDNLKYQLNARVESTGYDVQRAVMGNHLIGWLHESGLDRVLTQLFTHAPLQLNNVMLCDYGNGFNRHGAWSNWLEEKYALLPALGSTLIPPPLPPVKRTANALTSKALPRKLPAVLWSTGLILVLLSVHILNTTWLVHQQRQQFNRQLQQLTLLDELSLQTLQRRIGEMERVHQAWSMCMAIPRMHFWGLSPCQRFVDKIEKQVQILRGLPTISTRGSTTVFASGSARLLSGATPLLKKIEALIKDHPQHKILIVGHSDNTGSDSINYVLSAQRAEVVLDWLIQQGVEASRLHTRAVGATEPVAGNDSAFNRQQNRRVEIVVLPSP